MRTAVTSLAGGIAIAVATLALPAQALAASVPFFYGPILNCTGYFSISATVLDPGSTTTREVNYTPVSDKAIPNNPDSSDKGVSPTLPSCVSLCDAFVLFNNLIRLAVSVLITIFIPVMLIIGGYYYMFSGGNPGNRATGQKIITGTLLGTLFILCSALIVSQIMVIAFRDTWGDQLRAQATAAGVDISKVPDFTWNELSCTPIDGGVEIKAKEVKPATDAPTTNSPTTQQPAPTQAYCTTTQDKANSQCVTGWTTHPNCKAGQAACLIAKGHACAAACTARQSAWTGTLTKDGQQCRCVSAANKVIMTPIPR